MLSNFFVGFLITSFAGSVIGLILSLFTPVIRRRCSAAFIYYAWVLVLAVMILPFEIDVFKGDAGMQNVTEDITGGETLNADAENVPQTVPEVMPFEKEENFETERVVKTSVYVLSAVWLVGFAVVFAYKTGNYLLFVSNVRGQCERIQLDESANLLPEKLCVYVCGAISSPMIIGVFRPMLLLPGKTFTSKELNNIIRHENVHFKRRDVWVKWFCFFVQSVHWFNPMSYYICRKVNEECEISCDAAVTMDMSGEEKRDYAMTILSLLSVSVSKPSTLSSAMADSKKTLKKRFTFIKNGGKKSRAVTVISAIVVIALIACISILGAILNGKFVVADDAGGATATEVRLPISEEDALKILKEQLIIAYENTYGEYVPKSEDPGSMSGDKERLPFIIENLKITKNDGKYYTVPVIWDFLIEIKTGRIYKYYNGLDEMTIPFEPLDKNALSFAG